MSSSTTIHRLAVFLGVVLLVASGCGTQGNPLSATDGITTPDASAATQAVNPASAFQSNKLPSDGVAIKVTPSALVLHSEGAWVTVHTNLPFTSVKTDTLELWVEGDSVSVDKTFPDDRGNLVAKFEEAAVKAIIPPLERKRCMISLTLTGEYTEGGTFSGSDRIMVKADK